jgi:glycosyltransferase involved in cell wall biosynthesis
MKNLDIIIPTHNELDSLDELFSRVENIVLSIQKDKNINIGVIIIDDSTDETIDHLNDYADKKNWLTVIRLTRQFGQINAIIAGLNYTKANAVIVMDADLQDPPEVIPQMIDAHLKGSDIVLIKRKSENKSILYRVFSKIFYKTQSALLDISIPENVGEFRLLSRRAIDFIITRKEVTTFFRGISLWPGYQFSFIEIDRSKRFAGETKYNLVRSFLVALDGIISFSSRPLRLSSALSFLMLLMAFLGSVYAIVLRLYTSTWVPGWTLLFIAIMFFTGIQLLIMGIISEYILRISENIKQRPRYVINYIKKQQKIE